MSCRAPLKVLLLTTSFPLSKGSRSGVFIQKMVEQLPADVQATVLAPDDDGSGIALAPDRYSVVRFRYAPRSWQQLAHGAGGITAALARRKRHLLLLPPMLCSCLLTVCLLARKADVLHANWSINGVMAGLAGLIWGKPVVTTLRGSDVNVLEKSWLMRQLAGSCLSLSQGVVTVSPSLKQVVANQYPRYADKVRVIANGMDPAFLEVGKKRGDGQNGLVRFLCAGNLIPGKGVHLILEAAASLAADSWILDIVGDGPERKTLEACCQKHPSLNSRVFFHGSVAPEHMPAVMGRADAFVFASFAEGRPNVVLEAMAARLPVIASAIPAVLEIVEDGREGLLFPPGDVGILAEQMAVLLDSPEQRRRLGSNAGARLESMGLSWQAAAAQYAALYAAVVGPDDRETDRQQLDAH